RAGCAKTTCYEEVGSRRPAFASPRHTPRVPGRDTAQPLRRRGVGTIAMPRFTPRKGMPSPRLNEGEFRRRFLAQFQDPAFAELSRELDQVAAAAWDAYAHSRKAPRTHKAGSEFA